MYRFDSTELDAFVDLCQTAVSIFVAAGIVDICVVALLYITDCNKRRKYYVTNYVSIGLYIAVGAITALGGIILVTVLMSQFYGIDWTAFDSLIEKLKAGNATYYEISQSPVMFIIGYVVYLIVLADVLAWAYNLIWKRKLMQGEKALLERAPAKEAA